MPVTAKFLADFSNFQVGVAEADEQLGTLSASAVVAGTSIKKLALVTEQGVSPFNTLRGSLNQFDGALSSVGVHIGPEIRALGEFGDAAGKTSQDLGLLATAGLGVAAVFAAYNLTKVTLEFFGLNKAIGDATIRLYDFGLARETAAAKQDAINLAITHGAKAMISYTDAIKFNTKYQVEWEKQLKAPGLLIAYKEELHKAAREVWHLTEAQRVLIEKGVALNVSHADIAKGLSLTTDAVDTYVVALQAKTTADKKAADEARRLADAAQKLNDHLFGADLAEKAKLYAAEVHGVGNVVNMTKAAQAELNTVMGAAYEVLVRAGRGASAAAAEYRALRDASTDFAAINARLAAMPDPYAAKQRERMQAIADTDRSIFNQGTTLDANAEYWRHAGEIADQEMAKTKAAVESVTPAASAAASSINQSFSLAFANIGTDADSMAARVVAALHLAEVNKQNSTFFGPNFGTADTINRMGERNAGLAIRSYGTGGPVMADGPIFAHAGEYVLPKGGAGGASGTTVYATITITGQGASAGRDAADALAARLKQTGRRI